MAVFNTAQLRDILVRGRFAAPEPAREFVDELEDRMGDALAAYPTNDQVNLGFGKVLRAIAEAEARQARHMNQAVGILIAALALAVGIILGFG